MASAIHLGNPSTGHPTCGQRASYGTHDPSKVTCQRCAKIARDRLPLNATCQVCSTAHRLNWIGRIVDHNRPDSDEQCAGSNQRGAR